MFPARITPEQWAEARRLRAAGATFPAIGRELGLRPKTICSRARRESWPSTAAKPALAKSGRPVPRPADADEARRRLLQRIYTLTDLNLEITELRMQKQLKIAKRVAKSDDDELPPEPREEDKQPIVDAVKTLEQTKELHTDLHRSDDGGARPGSAQGGASETAALHRDIAERLGKVIPPS